MGIHSGEYKKNGDHVRPMQVVQRLAVEGSTSCKLKGLWLSCSFIKPCSITSVSMLLGRATLEEGCISRCTTDFCHFFSFFLAVLLASCSLTCRQ